MLSAESATPTAPLRLTVWAYCKAGDGLGALFSREVSANGSAWQRVCCESDYELELATEDATGIVSSADAPLCSAMDWWLGRLSRPVRFASRHLEEARHALLPDAPSRRLPDAPSLRAGFEARVAQLEAAAAVSALSAEAGATLGLAGLLEELPTPHLLFDAAALDQFTEAANRFLNAFPLADSELDHTFPET
jgi:hypothetical protein